MKVFLNKKEKNKKKILINITQNKKNEKRERSVLLLVFSQKLKRFTHRALCLEYILNSSGEMSTVTTKNFGEKSKK